MLPKQVCYIQSGRVTSNIMFYLPGISLYTCHIRNGYVTSVMIFKKLHKISKYHIKSCILWDVPQYKTLRTFSRSLQMWIEQNYTKSLWTRNITAIETDLFTVTFKKALKSVIFLLCVCTHINFCQGTVFIQVCGPSSKHTKFCHVRNAS